MKRISDFNRELNTRQGNIKVRSIKLKELRTVTLLKKEHLIEPLQKCKSYAEMLQCIKPLIIAYIQCSLPLEEIVEFVNKKFNLKKKTVNIRLTS